MDISLAGRTAVITGSSKGIGLGIALRFAQSGADVAIVARGRDALTQAEKQIREAGGRRVVGAVADVARAGDIQRAYDEIMSKLGRIDIVVNNAGTSRAGPFEGLTDEIMQQDLDQKFFAALRLTRLVWEQMKARHWGRIINVLNIGAKAPRGGSAPTTISRAAGMALTKVLGGGCAAQHSGQRIAGRNHRSGSARAGGKARRRSGRRLSRPFCQRHPARPCRRSLPIWPACWRRTPARTSPAPQSMWMAGARRSFDSHTGCFPERGARATFHPRIS